MAMTLKSIFLLFLHLTLSIAQDTCNLLPIEIAPLPFYSLVPHSLNKTNLTICEKYTPTNSTQYAWITNLINTAFTGDFTPLPNLWPANPNGTYQSTGILDPNAVYRDPCFEVTKVNLVPWFNGTFKSTYRGGKAVAKNFLDGGSVLALSEGVPAWDEDSNQYKMMTHFYQYFGIILGCSSPEFPKYEGGASQAQVRPTSKSVSSISLTSVDLS